MYVCTELSTADVCNPVSGSVRETATGYITTIIYNIVHAY